VIEGDRVVHYGMLDAAIDRATTALQDAGVKEGDAIGVSMPGTALHLVVVYALGRIGAVQIDLPLMNTPASRQALVDRFGIAAVVGKGADLHGARIIAPQQSWLDRTGPPAAAKIAPSRPDAIFRINLSSGTTGLPKAVALSHGQYIRLFEREAAFFPLRPTDRYLASVDLEFVSGLRRSLEILNAGATVVLAPRVIDAAPICDLVDRYAITIMMLTVGTAANLLSFVAGSSPRWPGVRLLRIGSSPIPAVMRTGIGQRLTPHLMISYGTNHIGNVALADAALQARHPDTVGRPTKDVEIQIVDADHRPLPHGELGAVRIRGPGFPTAYLDDADATARDFRDGWYYPGDLGVLTAQDDLLFKGRSDDMINVDGIKVFPIEIEQEMLNHPDIAEVAAFALPSARFHQIPAAAVRLHRPTDLPGLLEFCRQRLGVRMPHNIFVLTALPKNAMGKVLRRELAEIVRQQMPDTGAAG
jgi:acyl-coenzyme A synthetase/AMP-(fatty) acid ligase